MTYRGNTLYIVVPCFNEEEVLCETAHRLRVKLGALSDSGMISPDSRILFVDDGSRDHTWERIKELCGTAPEVAGLKLARNAGHQFALLAGLSAAQGRADMVISMDADLQDDVEAVDSFVREYHSGADVVYGVRSSRKSDSAFKRESAAVFYKLMKLLGADIVANHADYRLLSARALKALLEFGEVDLFLRGVVPLVGHKSAIVEYERHERFAGQSKYPLMKMLSFALNGITAFSVKPLRLITFLGLLIFAGSVLLLFYFLVLKLLGRTVDGWATLMGSIWALGGIQLLCLGVTGEYIGRIYKEVKHRPRYIVEESTLSANSKGEWHDT